jgi:hypothetical protein
MGSPREAATVPARRGFCAIVFFADSTACFAFVVGVGFAFGLGDSGEASAALIGEYKTTVTASAQRHLDGEERRMQLIAPI